MTYLVVLFDESDEALAGAVDELLALRVVEVVDGLIKEVSSWTGGFETHLAP